MFRNPSDLSDLEFELARIQALRQGLPVSQYLARRQQVEAQRDAMPDVEYRNGVMFVDGQRATPEQQAQVQQQNPYRFRPGQAVPLEQRPYGRNDLRPTSDALNELPQGFTMEQTTISAIPATKIAGSASAGHPGAGNPIAGADAWKRGTLAKVAGNVTTRTGKARS